MLQTNDSTASTLVYGLKENYDITKYNNTIQLDVEAVKKKLLTVEYVKNKLERIDQ